MYFGNVRCYAEIYDFDRRHERVRDLLFETDILRVNTSILLYKSYHKLWKYKLNIQQTPETMEGLLSFLNSVLEILNSMSSDIFLQEVKALGLSSFVNFAA